MSKTKGATTATNDDDEAPEIKIDKIWTELNANGHSLTEISGFLREISSLQNSGCKQSSSVQNKTVRLFCCGSMYPLLTTIANQTLLQMVDK